MGTVLPSSAAARDAALQPPSLEAAWAWLLRVADSPATDLPLRPDADGGGWPAAPRLADGAAGGGAASLGVSPATLAWAARTNTLHVQRLTPADRAALVARSAASRDREMASASAVAHAHSRSASATSYTRVQPSGTYRRRSRTAAGSPAGTDEMSRM